LGSLGWAAADGTAILAVADGRVQFAGPMAGFGNVIIINHLIGGHVISTVYGHMWTGHLYVATGDTVTAGQHIGDVGAAGNSTGPHLHFQVHPTGWPANPIDPAAWLAENLATSLDEPALSPAGCIL
jgi:murein DD-endopeptidase